MYYANKTTVQSTEITTPVDVGKYIFKLMTQLIKENS